MTSFTIEEFEERFEALAELFQTADIALSQGKTVSFVALEEEMNTLCAAAENAPPEIAAKLRAPMAQMISTLDALVIKLEDFKEQKKREQSA